MFREPSQSVTNVTAVALGATALALAMAVAIIAVAFGRDSGVLDAQPRTGPLVLISLDGFRSDYLEKAPAPHLRALAARGVRARGLVPVFPSKTFPNHYTIVTGQYPGRHGIVGNTIRDVPTGRTFAMSNRTEVRDPMWWGGEPIWVTAERAGLRTGTLFWPGSEARINGVMPTYRRPYDEGMRGEARVDEVLRWLDLPASRRPSFVTLYFEDTDTAGHRDGPDSEAVRRAIVRVDGYVGRLIRGLDRRGLLTLANVVVVSDHGMADVVPGRVIRLSDHIALGDVDVVELNPTVSLIPRAGKEESVYRALAAANPHLKVYRRAETPPAWRYRDHPRIPPIVGVVDEGWQIVRGTAAERVARAVAGERGSHGYDPSLRSMHGLFIAAGPAFTSGTEIPAFENVHVYNVLARVLGIRPSPNDGDEAIAERLVRYRPVLCRR